MENEFLPFEESKEIIELGFNEPTLAHYITTKNIRGRNSLILSGTFNVKDKRDLSILSAPMYQQAFSFFAESYSIFGNICLDYEPNLFRSFIYDDTGTMTTTHVGKSYSEVRLFLIREIITMIKVKSRMKNNLKK